MKVHRIHTEGGPILDTTAVMSGLTYCDAMLVHVSAAPTTSEYFTVTLVSAAGVTYNSVLYKLDLAAASTTDINLTDAFPPLLPGDALKTTYTNTDARTIGVTYILR